MNNPTEAQKFARERNYSKGIIRMFFYQVHRLKKLNTTSSFELKILEKIENLLTSIERDWNVNTIELKERLGIKTKEQLNKEKQL
jgi:hypothetical protein